MTLIFIFFDFSKPLIILLFFKEWIRKLSGDKETICSSSKYTTLSTCAGRAFVSLAIKCSLFPTPIIKGELLLAPYITFASSLNKIASPYVPSTLFNADFIALR